MNNDCLHRNNKLNSKKMSKIITGLKNNIKHKQLDMCIKGIDRECLVDNSNVTCMCNYTRQEVNNGNTAHQKIRTLSDLVVDTNALSLQIKKVIMKLYDVSEN